jgi:Uma2 family endonuclease
VRGTGYDEIHVARTSPGTVEQLYLVPDGGKAEIVDGTVVVLEPTGDAPGYAAGEIFASLREYVRRTRRGRAVGDNVGFLVNLPHRQSFSPDAAYYVGPPAGMKFFQGAPQFAAEIRSERDYDPAAEIAMAAKRADYFAAGTLVVWDVDLLGDEVVRVYRASDATTPVAYRRGQVAHAEPAVPGWSFPVDDLFA